MSTPEANYTCPGYSQEEHLRAKVKRLRSDIAFYKEQSGKALASADKSEKELVEALEELKVLEQGNESLQ